MDIGGNCSIFSDKPIYATWSIYELYAALRLRLRRSTPTPVAFLNPPLEYWSVAMTEVWLIYFAF